ncbi:MAG TPA: hypothetical protein VH592_15170 [Gemmataceae bacterium]|jgi:hypothetical protein
MRNRRLAQCLLCLLFLSCLVLGCQTFSGEKTLNVLVRDAETKKPVPTAEVYLCERLKGDGVAPCRSAAVFTEANGNARLRTEPGGEHGYQLQAVAQGYLPEKIDLPAEKADARHPTAGKNSTPADADKSAADAIVEVYAAPDFSVELVLPPGYRGLVKAEIQVQDNVLLPAGQRCFRFPVSASGDVLVKGPPQLRRVSPHEFRARYGDGPVLGTTMDAQQVGFRWLRGAGNQHLFVIGNQVDYETLHRQVAPEETQTALGAADDPAWANRSHKYRYGKMTAKNYEK